MKRNCVIILKVSSKEKEKIRSKAEALGITSSCLIRFVFKCIQNEELTFIPTIIIYKKRGKIKVSNHKADNKK